MVVQLAIDRLVRLKMIRRDSINIATTDAKLRTSNQSRTGDALRKHQRQVLLKSIESLESDPIDKRNHTSMTMAINVKKIPEAKIRIQSFLREITAYLEDGERDEVYEMTINLFPVTHRVPTAATTSTQEDHSQ